MLYQYNHSISAIILELIDFGIPDINSYMLLLWREFEIELNVYGGVLIFFRCGLFYLLLDLDFSIRFGEGHWPCENKGAAIYNIHQHRHIRSPSSSLSLSHTRWDTRLRAQTEAGGICATPYRTIKTLALALWVPRSFLHTLGAQSNVHVYALCSVQIHTIKRFFFLRVSNRLWDWSKQRFSM